jgi:hypothetical protein
MRCAPNSPRARGEAPSGQEPEQRDATIRRSDVGRIVLAALLAEVLEPLRRRGYHALRTLSAVAPVTKRSSKRCVVVMRQACPMRQRGLTLGPGRDPTRCAQPRSLCGIAQARPQPWPRPAQRRRPAVSGCLCDAHPPRTPRSTIFGQTNGHLSPRIIPLFDRNGHPPSRPGAGQRAARSGRSRILRHRRSRRETSSTTPSTALCSSTRKHHYLGRQERERKGNGAGIATASPRSRTGA